MPCQVAKAALQQLNADVVHGVTSGTLDIKAISADREAVAAALGGLGGATSDAGEGAQLAVHICTVQDSRLTHMSGKNTCTCEGEGAGTVHIRSENHHHLCACSSCAYVSKPHAVLDMQW